MLDYCYVFYRLHAVVCMDLKKKSMMVVVVGLVVSLVIEYIHNLINPTVLMNVVLGSCCDYVWSVVCVTCVR